MSVFSIHAHQWVSVFSTHVYQCMSSFRPMHTNVCQSFRSMYTNVCQSFRPLHTKVCQSFRPMHTIVCQSFLSRSLLDSIRKFYQRYKRTAGNDVPNVCWSCILPSQTVSDSSFFYVEKAFVESIRLPYILYFVGKMKLKEMAVLFITI